MEKQKCMHDKNTYNFQYKVFLTYLTKQLSDKVCPCGDIHVSVMACFTNSSLTT